MKFIKNNATQGPAFITFGDQVVDYQNSTFEENIRVSGGDFSAKPEKLRLRIYQVNEAFIFTDDVPIHKILQSSETVK